jgi:parvulin-like peptidyl-prolyl isomerase
VPIREEQWARLVAALDADRRATLTDADRRFVLDRLIEEELLVQHGVSLGLLRSDRRVRADLVSAVLAGITAAADAYEPDDARLAAFYAENRDYFATPARLHVRHLFFGGAGAERAAQAASRLRAGEPFERVREELADPDLAPVPDAPLPPAKLREYLGPTPLEAALALEPGGVSDPIAAGAGHHVLVLVDRTESQPPPLAEVAPQVRLEMKRREGDRLLRERLDALRAEADVELAPSLREAP